MTYKKLAVGILIGLLLIGVGSGVAFWEFSSFEYMGEKQFESKAQDIAKETFEETIQGFDENRPIMIYTPRYYIDREAIQIIGDETLKLDEICFDITHDKRLNQAVVSQLSTYYVRDNEESLEELIPPIQFEVYLRNNSQVMRHFEQVLKDLKDKKLYEYQPEQMQQLVIRVAPQNVDRVVIK